MKLKPLALVSLLEGTVLVHDLGHEDGIEGSTTQELISRNEEFNSVFKDNRFADASNFDIIFSSSCERHGVFEIFRVVNELDTRCLRQSLFGSFNINGLFGFDNNSLRVSTVGGNTDSRATISYREQD